MGIYELSFIDQRIIRVYSGENTNGNYKDRYVIGVKLVPHIKIIRCYQNPDGSYTIPEGTCHDSVVSYDTDMHTLVNYLRIVCNMPCDKIAALISDGTEGLVNPSTGTVVNSVKYFSESCAESIEDIVNSNGGRVKQHINSKTDYLIADRTNVSDRMRYNAVRYRAAFGKLKKYSRS